jgi:hypothetical protein
VLPRGEDILAETSPHANPSIEHPFRLISSHGMQCEEDRGKPWSAPAVKVCVGEQFG